ncbi:calcium-binding protein [Streptomyces sp. enrichment culture]|uniref:calcium-binding protein n=1 Tax=Streptomyces sp. enrichment culture TaxID=1795815 RepID=UPI003F54B7EF
MRTRLTVAAVSGALALSALAVPAAQAVSGDEAGIDRPSVAEQLGGSAATSRSVTAAEAPTVSNVKINNGRAVVVGSGTAKTFTVSLTASHPSGIQGVYIDLWHGTDPTDADGWLPPNEGVTCTELTATSATCKMTITARPGLNDEQGVGDLYANALAGTWKVGVGALANDGSEYANDYYKTHRVQRKAVLTINASPEPIVKGRTLSIKGTFTRANWETGTYSKYTNQYLQLQFKKAGSSTWTKVKTAKSNSYGAISTSHRATYDGTWRFYFSGASTTTSPLTVSPGDYVDVR